MQKKKAQTHVMGEKETISLCSSCLHVFDGVSVCHMMMMIALKTWQAQQQQTNARRLNQSKIWSGRHTKLCTRLALCNMVLYDVLSLLITPLILTLIVIICCAVFSNICPIRSPFARFYIRTQIVCLIAWYGGSLCVCMCVGLHLNTNEYVELIWQSFTSEIL